ncbi:MAG TPA: sigma factor, ECF subfamily protein, partial [Opitutaceae bacterium]|nr:sigma factor, ECF subfamily protein [Opitutaceae bacterium]
WDQRLIRRGVAHLAASGEGREVTRFHLEAGIAACHCLAPSWEATDWRQILELYAQLLALDGSPVVALNRAVAVAQVDGPAAGLCALDAIEDGAALAQYHLYHAVAGQLWLDAGDPARAAQCYRRALELAALPAERELLQQRLAQTGG